MEEQEHSPPPTPIPEPTTSADFEQADGPGKGPKKVTVEEIEDEEAPGRTKYSKRWWQSFPGPAGVTKPGEREETAFESVRADKMASGEAPWEPFESEEDWQLARWLIMSGVSQAEINSFLKMAKVSTSVAAAWIINLSILRFRMARSLPFIMFAPYYKLLTGCRRDQSGIVNRSKLGLVVWTKTMKRS
jgi:hypothetical protein